MWVMGLDLGQTTDYTAVAVVQRIEEDRPWYDENKPASPPIYHVRHLERVKLGTPYPAIVARVVEIMSTPDLSDAALVVDQTGVGRPVVDLLRQAGLKPVPVTITGGDKPSRDADGWKVPKRDLVVTLQVLLQAERLKIAEGLPDAATLVKELLAFKVKIDAKTAHDSYETPWRDGAHDDLVLAVALATWYAERGVSRASMDSYL